MGPRTAYSTFFTAGFMVCMVSTLALDETPFSVIFSLGNPLRVSHTLDKVLEDSAEKLKEQPRGPSPARCAPPLPANRALGPRLKSLRFLGASSSNREAAMVQPIFPPGCGTFWSVCGSRPHGWLLTKGMTLKLCT